MEHKYHVNISIDYEAEGVEEYNSNITINMKDEALLKSMTDTMKLLAYCQ